MRIAFDVTGTPAPKGSSRAILIGGKARLVPGSSNVNTTNVRAWAKAVKAAAEAEMSLPIGPWSVETYAPTTDPVRVCIDFRLAKPKSTKRALPTVKPDADKLARCCLDAMTGVVWKDDAQVTTLLVTKRYAANPGARIVVEVEP